MHNSKSSTSQVPLPCKGGQADLRSLHLEATAVGGGLKGPTTKARHKSGTREVERRAAKENRNREQARETLSTLWFHLQMTTNRSALLTMRRDAQEVATVFTFAEFVDAANRIRCGSTTRA